MTPNTPYVFKKEHLDDFRKYTEKVNKMYNEFVVPLLSNGRIDDK